MLADAGYHHEDILAYAPVDDALLTADFSQVRALLRLDDAAELRAGVESYKLRWRRFLAALNLFQFLPDCQPFTTSEVIEGSAPELDLNTTRAAALSAEWHECLEAAADALALEARRLDPGSEEQGIRLGTRRRIKGLEFRAVALVLSESGGSDVVERFKNYVAVTRAREYLLVVRVG